MLRTRAGVVPDMPRSYRIVSPLPENPDIGEVSPTAQLALRFKRNLRGMRSWCDMCSQAEDHLVVVSF
jgi:hypothetical protein